MTSRWIAPDGVTVTEAAIRAQELDTRMQVQQRLIDTSRPGRRTGGVVTIGTPTSRFNVSACRAYNARGDMIIHEGSSNVALADYSTGAVNYVVVCYRESAGTPEAHESSGTSENVLATRSSELKVITQTEYDAMSASEDSGDLEINLQEADVALDAQDRLVILAVILGKGYSGGSPVGYISGDFTNGNIVQQAALPSVKTAAQPATPNITGVNLAAITDNHNLGEGTLTFNFVSSSDMRLSWAAPDADGLPETAGAEQAIDLTADVDTIELPSSTTSFVLTVEVVPTLLPITDQTDTITIAELYEDDGPIFSASDALHRSKLGSYVPTQDNSHGEGFSDFAQQIAVLPQTTIIGSDFLDTEARALLARITTPGSTEGTVDRTHLWHIPNGEYDIRCYKARGGSGDALEIVTNARWDGTQWVRDNTGAGFLSSRLAFSSTGVSQDTYTGTSPFANSAWTQSWASDAFNISNQSMLRLGEGFLLAANLTSPRLKARSSGTTRTFIADISSTSASQAGTRLYAYGGGFEITMNALWDGTANWSKDADSLEALKFVIEPTGVKIHHRSTASGTWTESTWALAGFDYDASASELTLRGRFTAGERVEGGAQNTSAYSTPRFYSSVTVTTDTRHLIQQTLTSAGYSWRKYIVDYAGVAPFFGTEETINAFWNGTEWDSDIASHPSTLIRQTDDQTIHYRKAATSGTWADGAWTASDWSLGQNTALSLFRAGIAITSSAPDPIAAGNYYRNSFPRAWGRVRHDSSSSSMSKLNNLDAGVGISALAYDATDFGDGALNSLLVTLDFSFSSVNGFIVIPGRFEPKDGNASNQIAVTGGTDWHLVVRHTATNQFRLLAFAGTQQKAFNDNATGLAGDAAWKHYVTNFVVFGNGA